MAGMSRPAVDLRDDLPVIHGIRERIEAAENAGDADVFVSLMAEDAVLMVPDQPVQDGKPACAAFVRNVLSGLLSRFTRQISYVSDEVAVLGDTAFDRGTFSFTVSPRDGGMTTRVTGKYLWLLRRDAGDAWQMWRMMLSLDEGDEPTDDWATERVE